MPSLRDYRDRIKSVKSTRKITSAMKMVAASKLRKAQDQAERSQPYARTMAEMLARLAANIGANVDTPLLSGTGSDRRHVVIVVTADRGLCGGFNVNAVKHAEQIISSMERQGKEVSIVCVGRKGFDLLARTRRKQILKTFRDVFGKANVEFAQANQVAEYIIGEFEDGHFDECTIVFNQFKSVLVQRPSSPRLIPFEIEPSEGGDKPENRDDGGLPFTYSFEPGETQILERLLPRNIGVQIYRAMLDSAAGEQAARMTAMDNATRNAGEMINDLTLQYNRARQAYITKELIEIISGAEAL